MEKTIVSLVVGMLLFLFAVSQGFAADNAAAGTGMSGTPGEFSDMEKTLKQGKVDDLERRIADLKQEQQFLSERVKMLERSVNDLKNRL